MIHNCEVTFSTILVQGVCYCDSMELPSYDAGLEKCSLFGSWKHTRLKTCTGETHIDRHEKSLKTLGLSCGATLLAYHPEMAYLNPDDMRA